MLNFVYRIKTVSRAVRTRNAKMSVTSKRDRYGFCVDIANRLEHAKQLTP
jgi:hypothetical protein